jgi:hypothetical protein
VVVSHQDKPRPLALTVALHPARAVAVAASDQTAPQPVRRLAAHRTMRLLALTATPRQQEESNLVAVDTAAAEAQAAVDRRVFPAVSLALAAAAAAAVKRATAAVLSVVQETYSSNGFRWSTIHFGKTDRIMQCQSQ